VARRSRAYAAPLATPPAETDDLARFNGGDAVVMTWTSAEASAMASLFTSGYPTSAWYEYRNDIARYIPLVTGPKAPFDSREADMARYYHSLGLYFPCTVDSSHVLLIKSGLHMDYDGPAVPLYQLVQGIAETVGPKIFITTGPGGGIGAGVSLGDVVVAGTVRFDRNQQFAAKPWASAAYIPSAAPAGTLGAVTPTLTSANAARIPNAKPVPRIFSAATDAVVTTDFFAFDDSTDYYKLEGLGRACDVGDAMVGYALQSCPQISWYSIRNASDPQIPNPNNDINEASKEAAQIYASYGGLTTAASLIATWAIIQAAQAGASAACEKPGATRANERFHPKPEPLRPTGRIGDRALSTPQQTKEKQGWHRHKDTLN
jgi:hypothetical protein